MHSGPDRGRGRLLLAPQGNLRLLPGIGQERSLHYVFFGHFPLLSDIQYRSELTAYFFPGSGPGPGPGQKLSESYK